MEPVKMPTEAESKGLPRISWNKAIETTLMDSLSESVDDGLKGQGGFKGEAWNRAAKAIKDYHGMDTRTVLLKCKAQEIKGSYRNPA